MRNILNTWLALLSLTVLTSPVARAEGLGLDPSSFIDPAKALLASFVKNVTLMVGVFADHRPYEPATPLGTIPGVDFGLTVTMVKIPDTFNEQLKFAGSSAAALPAVPIPTLQVNKGLFGILDVGASYVGYKTYAAIGGDAKLAFFQPEEGPTWALRGCHTYAKISFVETHTTSIQLLASKKLEFADPYIGVAGQYISGTTKLTTKDFGISIIYQEFIAKAQAYSAFGFVGTSLRFPVIGFELTMEGSYNLSGAHTLGTKIGFEF